MRAPTRFLLCALPALAAAALLPVYPRRTMTRSQIMGHGGDVITWGFELCSLPGFFEGYRYMGPEQHPLANLVANLALAAALALALAFVATRLWARRRAPRR